jgi:hypothetical protein
VTTSDKFHVVAHASQAVDKTDPALKGLSCHRISMRFAAVHESGFDPNATYAVTPRTT